jgi:hypothetical protein
LPQAIRSSSRALSRLCNDGFAQFSSLSNYNKFTVSRSQLDRTAKNPLPNPARTPAIRRAAHHSDRKNRQRPGSLKAEALNNQLLID